MPAPGSARAAGSRSPLLRPSEPEAPRPCPRCGTAHAPGQEYCLDCGLPLTSRRTLRSRTRRASALPTSWVWPVLFLLVLGTLGALPRSSSRAAGRPRRSSRRACGWCTSCGSRRRPRRSPDASPPQTAPPIAAPSARAPKRSALTRGPRRTATRSSSSPCRPRTARPRGRPRGARSRKASSRSGSSTRGILEPGARLPRRLHGRLRLAAPAAATSPTRGMPASSRRTSARSRADRNV